MGNSYRGSADRGRSSSANGNGHHNGNDDHQEPEQERGTRDKPAAEFVFGRIRVVVWKNTSKKDGDWYSSSLSRSYFDENDKKWKTASTLGKDDLLTGAEALRAAFLFITDRQNGKA